MTWPPAASIRAAAAITSITMKGGTSLRREGASHCPNRFLKVASYIDFCYFAGGPVRPVRKNGALAPQTGRIVRLIRGTADKGISRIRPAANRQNQSRNCCPDRLTKTVLMSLQIALRKKASALTALVTAAALALTP